MVRFCLFVCFGLDKISNPISLNGRIETDHLEMKDNRLLFSYKRNWQHKLYQRSNEALGIYRIFHSNWWLHILSRGSWKFLKIRAHLCYKWLQKCKIIRIFPCKLAYNILKLGITNSGEYLVCTWKLNNVILKDQ